MSIDARTGNLLGLAACVGLMAYALFAQQVLELAPCPLCVFQRIAVVAMGMIFLLAAGHNPGTTGRRIYAVLLSLAALGGIGVAARHVWLQNLPPDKVPSCGPGLEYMLDTFPFNEVMQMVLTGSGECAEVTWSFLGLSMPAWVIVTLVLLGAYAFWVNWTGALRIRSGR